MNIFIPLVVMVLVAANALYVAAEFAAVSVRKSRIRQMASEGDRLARLFLPIVDERAELDRYVAACQIGITLSSLILGAYGQATIPPLIEPALNDIAGLGAVAAQSVSAALVLISLTAFQVVLGELVPKSVALQFSTRVALVTAVPMRWSLTAFRPLIWLLNGSGILILRLMGIHDVGHGHIHSPAEIELLIAQSGAGGELSAEERLRMRQALHLGTRPAHEIMVPRRYIEALDINLPLDEVVAAIAASPYTRLPVYRDSIDNIIGTLHSKDVVVNEAGGRPKKRVEDLIQPATVAPKTISIDRLLALMREKSAPIVILVDEFGGVEGLATLEDVLAELFGEFADEFKEGQPSPRVLPNGAIRLPGLLPLDQVSLHAGESWDGSADTVGGHIMDLLGRVPTDGERLEIGSFDVVVERVEHHAVQSVLLRRARERVTHDG